MADLMQTMFNAEGGDIDATIRLCRVLKERFFAISVSPQANNGLRERMGSISIELDRCCAYAEGLRDSAKINAA